MTNHSEFNLSLMSLQPLSKEDRSCWHDLFENIVIAQGFPTPERNGEQGVELPFEVMTRLAGTLYSVSYQRGIYLKGFSTLLFPTASWTNSIQWHLVTGVDKHSLIPAGHIQQQDWIQIDDSNKLATARTFLGMYKDIVVHLGTKYSSLSYLNLGYSGAEEESPKPGISPDSAQIGTSGLGFFGATVAGKIRFTKGLSHTTHQDSYETMLDTARSLPIILFDNHEGSKRGWLVPTLSAILHMVHVWGHKNKLSTEKFHAKAESDPGHAAWTIIRRESKAKLRESYINGPDYYLHHLIMTFWTELDKKRELEALEKRKEGRNYKLESMKLLGWEIMDIVNSEPEPRRKQLNLEEDWKAVTDDVLVRFSQHLGDVILPAQGIQICSNWNSIPVQKNYLTATVRCLQHLSDRRQPGTRLLQITNKMYWCPDHRLFDDCGDCLHHSRPRECLKRPQTLTMSKNKGNSRPVSLPPDGAVIFGKYEQPPPQLSDRKRGIRGWSPALKSQSHFYSLQNSNIDERQGQMDAEEPGHHIRQTDNELPESAKTAEQHPEVQALPIGDPASMPKRRKKNTHGEVTLGDLSETEMAANDLQACQESAAVLGREATQLENNDNDGLLLASGTPPRRIPVANLNVGPDQESGLHNSHSGDKEHSRTASFCVGEVAKQ
jgi:hypothetical protein